MELKDFIKNVLIDISTAIEECQGELSDRACVAPVLEMGNRGVDLKTKDGYAKVSQIDFDVAVTTETKDGSSSSAGGGIRVLNVIKVGGKSTDESQNIHQSISRVKFSVPMILPYSKAEFQVKGQSVTSHFC